MASSEIATLTEDGDWPTPETASLWQRFWEETLSGGARKTEISEIRLALDEGQPRPSDGVYRVEVDPNGEAWICTPDFRRVAKLRRRARDRARGLMSARFVPDDNRAIVKRYGRGRARWFDPEDWPA